MDHSESQPTQQSSFDADLSAPMVDHLSKGWGWVRIICEGQVREEALCDSEITIGRRSTNKIQIKHSAISGEHCTIIYDQATRLACVRDHSTNGTYLNNERIPPNTTPFLNNRAIITLVRMGPECVSVQLSYNQPAYESEVPSPMGIYIITKPLGAGAFAQVFQCMHNSTGQLYALKIIEKKKYLKLTEHSRTTRTDTLNDEVNILYGLNHPNVIGVKQTFDSEQYLYTVLELVTGGDLFDKLLAQPERCFPEEEAHDYFAQLAHAIAYLHDKDIVHRDLKPENILLASPHSRQIKLADFGLSRVVRSGSVMTTICGTPQYLAPEVLDTQISAEGYSKAVDMWSIGVILYVLLSGNTPYSEENVEDLRARLRMFTPSFVGEIWNRVSSSAKDLITRLLEVDPSKRMTVHECLQHPWLSAFYSVHAAAAAAAAVVAQETTVRIQPQPSNVVMREPSVYSLDADETKEVVAVGNGSNGPTTSSTAVASAEVSGGGNGESSPLALLRPSVSDMSAPVEPSASAIMMGSRKRRPCDREPVSTSDSKRAKDGEC